MNRLFHLKIPTKERYDLQHFKLSIANVLQQEGKQWPKEMKVGRPSSVSIEKLYSVKKTNGNRAKPIPEANIRKDGCHHWPEITNKQLRCKLPGCGMRTYLKCTKCDVYLCLTKDRNCFRGFHS